VSFGQHALMKDARNQNTSGVLAVKDNVPAAFHSTKAGTNIVTHSAQRGIIGKHLATRLKIVDVTDGLVFAPTAKGVSADDKQVSFGTARETKRGHAPSVLSSSGIDNLVGQAILPAAGFPAGWTRWKAGPQPG
jgi:hypothetical protein